MVTTPTVDNAVAWFGAHTVTHHLDVVDRVTASIVNTLTAEGSTVRFYNANGYEFMTLKSGDVSKRFEPLFDEILVGTRHSEDGRLYAILKDGDSGLFRERSRLAALNTTQQPGAPRSSRGSAEKGDKEHDWNEVHVGDAGGFR